MPFWTPGLVRRSLLLALFVAAWLTGCDRSNAASASAEGTRSKSADRATLTVHLGYQRIGPPFLLKQRSAALARRLEALQARADWIEFQAGPPLLEAMRASAVDIGYVGETPPVFAQAGGVPFVYVAAEPAAPKAEAIVVPKGSTIRTLGELRGKRVALGRGSNVHYLLTRALASAKLTLNDIEAVYLAPADARSAFESGQVAAWVIWDPFLAAVELSGARVLRDGQGLVDNHFFYVVRRAFAERHPELVRAVLDEYRQLSDWERTHAEEAARLLAASSQIRYEALLLAERRHAYGILPITGALLDKQQRIANTFRDLGLIPRAIRLGDAFTPTVAYAGNR